MKSKLGFIYEVVNCPKIGQKYHLSWADHRCVWVLYDILPDGVKCRLITPKTNKFILANVNDLRHLKDKDDSIKLRNNSTKMKLIIAGGREFSDYALLETEVQKFILESLNEGEPIPKIEIISGKARGADTLGEQFAKKWNFPVIEMPADWNKHNKAAGVIRNKEMAKIATHAIIFWDGQSTGSFNMIENSRKYNLNYKVVRYESV